jgi:DNA-binding transcriptional regulator PaaX
MLKKGKKTLLFTLSLASDLAASPYRPFEFTYAQLYRLIPYTQSAIRGAVVQAKEEKLLNSYLRGGNTVISLTNQGRDTLHALFPGLFLSVRRRELVWSTCIFVEDTKRDPHFRSTRQTVLSYGYFPLTKGVYLYPGPTPAHLKESLQRIGMANHVTIVESKNFVLGDEKHLLSEAFDVPGIIRKEEIVIQYLEHFQEQMSKGEKIHSQTLQSFISFLPMASEFFQNDLGLLYPYFPREIQHAGILSSLEEVGRAVIPQL